jgi:hypothetical protein
MCCSRKAEGGKGKRSKSWTTRKQSAVLLNGRPAAIRTTNLPRFAGINQPQSRPYTCLCLSQEQNQYRYQRNQ